MLLNSVLSLCRLEVLGGVAETRFYYEEMRLGAAVTAVQPAYWDRIGMDGLGQNSCFSFKTICALP
jgi:hypothetical protein